MFNVFRQLNKAIFLFSLCLVPSTLFASSPTMRIIHTYSNGMPCSGSPCPVSCNASTPTTLTFTLVNFSYSAIGSGTLQLRDLSGVYLGDPEPFLGIDPRATITRSIVLSNVSNNPTVCANPTLTTFTLILTVSSLELYNTGINLLFVGAQILSLINNVRLDKRLRLFGSSVHRQVVTLTLNKE